MSPATSLSCQRGESNARVRYRGSLQVGQELLQPMLGGLVVLEAAGEGLVLQLVWQTLAESFPCPEEWKKKKRVRDPKDAVKVRK